jgi:hypothetical protein
MMVMIMMMIIMQVSILMKVATEFEFVLKRKIGFWLTFIILVSELASVSMEIGVNFTPDDVSSTCGLCLQPIQEEFTTLACLHPAHQTCVAHVASLSFPIPCNR